LVRNLYKSESLTTVARVLTSYTLYLVGVQEVIWDRGGHCKNSGLYIFLTKRKIKSLIGNRKHKIVLAVKKFEFVSERMLYTGCPTS
jgi:hypothetical protein